jgi:UDP:flavonoid glycosyltransferase YjiC (YdhE family)
MLACSLGISWHQVGVGSAQPAAVAEEIAASSRSRYTARGLVPTAPRSYVDPCPPVLQTRGWTSPVQHLPLRPEAHQRSTSTWSPPTFADPELPRVLITLGTVFSEPDTIHALTDAVVRSNVNVLVTGGMPVGGQPARGETPGSDREEVRKDRVDGGNAHYLPFVPLASLLADTDVMVAAGGSGTVLSALSRGIPMVLWPQGADQPTNAARAESAGVCVTVQGVHEVTAALAKVLSTPSYRTAARRVAVDIAAMPGPDKVLTDLVSLSRAKSPGY